MSSAGFPRAGLVLGADHADLVWKPTPGLVWKLSGNKPNKRGPQTDLLNHSPVLRYHSAGRISTCPRAGIHPLYRKLRIGEQAADLRTWTVAEEEHFPPPQEKRLSVTCWLGRVVYQKRGGGASRVRTTGSHTSQCQVYTPGCHHPAFSGPCLLVLLFCPPASLV